MPTVLPAHLRVASLQSNGDIVASSFDAGRVTVTQATSLTTAVTANGASGVITTQAASTGANSAEGTPFVVNNDKCKATSVVLLSATGGGGATTQIPGAIVGNVGNGSFDLTLTNGGSAALAAAVDVHFLLA